MIQKLRVKRLGIREPHYCSAQNTRQPEGAVGAPLTRRARDWSLVISNWRVLSGRPKDQETLALRAACYTRCSLCPSPAPGLEARRQHSTTLTGVCHGYGCPPHFAT